MPGMHSKPGTPCNDYKGYCDVFQKCREVNPSGPLATLRKILLSEESLRSVAQFLSLHWYLVLFLLMGVLVLMVSQHKIWKKSSSTTYYSTCILDRVLVPRRKQQRALTCKKSFHSRQQKKTSNYPQWLIGREVLPNFFQHTGEERRIM